MSPNELGSRGRSAGGREERSNGERMIVGRRFGSAVEGRGGRDGGLRDETPNDDSGLLALSFDIGLGRWKEVGLVLD